MVDITDKASITDELILILAGRGNPEAIAEAERRGILDNIPPPAIPEVAPDAGIMTDPRIGNAGTGNILPTGPTGNPAYDQLGGAGQAAATVQPGAAGLGAMMLPQQGPPTAAAAALGQTSGTPLAGGGGGLLPPAPAMDPKAVLAAVMGGAAGGGAAATGVVPPEDPLAAFIQSLSGLVAPEDDGANVNLSPVAPRGGTQVNPQAMQSLMQMLMGGGSPPQLPQSFGALIGGR